MERRLSRNFMFSASYTYSRLWGNYPGLANTDENGRTDPNVSRAFDLPWEIYDSHGKVVYGLLPTDRPHTFKLFGSYSLHSKLGTTTFAPIFFAFSGTPLSTQVQVIDLPVFVNGRGDMGRTPVFTNTDLLVYHDFHAFGNERYRFRIEMNASNLFNQATAIDYEQNYVNPNDGAIQFTDAQGNENNALFFKGFDYKAMMTAQQLRTNPLFGMANSFQSPRSIRFGFKFSF